MHRIAVVLVVAVALGGPLLATSCTTNDVTGRTQLILVPPDTMERLGSTAYADLTGPGAKSPLVTDPAWVTPLQEVGAAVAAAADQPRYGWEFRLVDEPGTVNAFCLPGGKIGFYTGIYPMLQDRDGMAIVMGHEVMHAILQHGNERMSQGLAVLLGTMAAEAALQDVKHRDAILGALAVGAQVGVVLPYSRRHESEADEQGLYLAARAGYDPEAALEVWERMAAASEGKRPPEFLSTHPDPRRRIEQMRAWMPRARELYAASTRQPNAPLPGLPAAK